MGLLGNIGYLYMRILILLLIVGLGTAGYSAAVYVYEFFSLKKYSGLMKTDWLKLTVLSLTALILIFILQQVLGYQSMFNFSAAPQPAQSVPLVPGNPNQSHLQHH